MLVVVVVVPMLSGRMAHVKKGIPVYTVLSAIFLFKIVLSYRVLINSTTFG